jgi:group I intron endonuclease
MVVYKTINLISGKSYIGKDKLNKPSYYGSGKLLLAAIKKYGKENFKKEIIEVCDSYEHMNEREVYWIEHFNAVEDRQFYNMKSGGDGGDCPTHYTKEFKEKMKVINQHNRMHGKQHTEKAKEKQRNAAVGRYSLEWFIDRYGNQLGNKKYETRCKNMKIKSSGKNNPFYGKAHKYEDHPQYTHIPEDILKKLILEGKSRNTIAKMFNTSATTITSKCKKYWGCRFSEVLS